MQLSYGSTMLVNGKWEMVNGKAASDIKKGRQNLQDSQDKLLRRRAIPRLSHLNDLARTAARRELLAVCA